MSLFWQETLILAFVAHTTQLSGKSMLGAQAECCGSSPFDSIRDSRFKGHRSPGSVRAW